MNRGLPTSHNADTPTLRNPHTPPLTLYRPNMRHEMGWWHSWTVMARNIWGARELIWQLFKRDFFAQYKKSFVGFFWIFVAPIMGIVSWVLLWKTNIYNPGETEVTFPVYVLVGQSAWGLFMGFLSSARSTLHAGGTLMLQVNYPHEALMFKQIASQLANYMLTFVTILAAMFLFGVMPSWGIFLYPLVALPLFFLGAALGLIISMISVVAVDINNIINLGIGFLIWTTPIRYSDKDPHPLLAAIIRYNPLTYLVCSARDMILHGRFYRGRADLYFACAGVSLLLFLLAWRLFFVSENKLIERMI